MSKVFRFHQGNNNIEDWQVTEPYGGHAIQAIQDPAGATAKKEITSIPSPFARMELMQNAFKRVAESQALEGNTIFHKMISDCFDVGELFFNFDTFANRLEIVVWDKVQDLQALLTSEDVKHRRLGETLKLYLEQDQGAHNFDRLQSIYLLNDRKGPNRMNILGGTSPSTLFFTSANHLETDIQFGKKKIFSEQYAPLYARDIEYQKFIYGLQNFIPDFNRTFKEVDDYLNVNFKHLPATHKTAIQHMTEAAFLSQYAALHVRGEGQPVEILGYGLRKKISDPKTIENTSDFVVDSSLYTGLKPLVLPNEKFTEKLRYTTDYWDSSHKAPHHDPLSLDDRSLPWVGEKYPYLTVNDLLEPYAIQTVFPIQKSKFFDSHFPLTNDTKKGYLIPIKKTFFDFFDLALLQGYTADGKPVFEMKPMAAGGLKAVLRIPIQNKKHITFERIYYPSLNDHTHEKPDIQRNKGVLIEHQFTLSVYPFLKLAESHKNVYRIGLMDRDIQPLTKARRYTLQFYQENTSSAQPIKAVKSRSRKERGDGLSSDFYVLEETFDYIQLHDGVGHSGLIVPIFPSAPKGTDAFTFAIDFGTTNTHIEYRKHDQEPVPFEINDDDIQLATLHDPRVEETDISLAGTGATALLLTLPHEFLPLRIGSGHRHYFPQRTVIHYSDTQDFNASTYALADINVSFTYERETIPKQIRFDTNLKWSDFRADNAEIKKIEAFFENLILLIRNKILLNGGDLDKTELVWFYPSSMLPYKVGMMELKWETLFHRYITKKRSPMKLSESIAPFYYYKNRLGVTATEKPVVSIDIGGGTSDIVVYQKNKPEILTSIRFAANAIFGDAYNSNPTLNGFVRKYIDRYQDLGIVSYYLPKLQRSEDIIGFLFSLEHNPELIKRNIAVSFAKTLREDPDFRIIFLLFYSSLVYHLANVMKAKGLASPAYITFSGTGSKVIDFADPRPKKKALGRLTQCLFEQVMGSPVDPIELKQYENPKEITCKGGLMIDNEIDIDDIKSVLIGNRENQFLENHPTTYQSIDPGLIESVVEEYRTFIELFFTINTEMNFSREFGVNPTQLVDSKALLTRKAKEYLLLGIEQKMNELEQNQAAGLSETLFFYPLIGGINQLAYAIAENQEST